MAMRTMVAYSNPTHVYLPFLRIASSRAQKASWARRLGGPAGNRRPRRRRLGGPVVGAVPLDGILCGPLPTLHRPPAGLGGHGSSS